MRTVKFGYWLHPDSHRVVAVREVPRETTDQEIEKMAHDMGLKWVG